MGFALLLINGVSICLLLQFNIWARWALGKEHPDMLASVSNLATILQSQGKYEEAESMNQRALEGFEKALGKEHPDTLASVSNLATILRTQEKYEEAESMNQRALEGFEKALEKEHPDTLTSVSNLALMLRTQGKYEEAEQMDRRVLEGGEKALGKEHPDTLTSVNNLALVLQDQGKYEKAEQVGCVYQHRHLIRGFLCLSYKVLVLRLARRFCIACSVKPFLQGIKIFSRYGMDWIKDTILKSDKREA
jgi:tetratricopeptide (TPR) repeat protein